MRRPRRSPSLQCADGTHCAGESQPWPHFVDRWGDDLLDGQGQDRSASVVEAVFPRILPGTTGHGEKGIGESLTLRISNAGEGTAGTLRIYTLEF